MTGVNNGMASMIGGGEPTLYPGFVPFVQFLKQLGLQVAVVSNGSRNDRILQAACTAPRPSPRRPRTWRSAASSSTPSGRA